MPSDFRWHFFLVSAGYLPDTNIFAVFALENASTHILAQLMLDYELQVSGTFIAFFLIILMVFGIFLLNSLIGVIREFLLSRMDQFIIRLLVYGK